MSSDLAKSSEPGIRIGLYEDWMHDQVVAMIAAEYGQGISEQAALFDAFYEAPFQREHGIRLVAVEDRTVCGFQSYFYWPYVRDGRTLRSFQSGNSIVAPAHRGKGIFAALLAFLSRNQHLSIDLLMGFPVEMSFGSFLRNGWANPLDLSWFARPLRPLSVLRTRKPDLKDWHFDIVPEPVSEYHPSDCFALSKSTAFIEWRRSYRGAQDYRYFHHREGSEIVRFDLKPNRRGRINELVIGDVVRSSGDPGLVTRAFGAMVTAALRHRHLTLVSIALNDRCLDDSLLQAAKKSHFFRLRPKIHFIVKAVEGSRELDIEDPRRWFLLRSDIDTW